MSSTKQAPREAVDAIYLTTLKECDQERDDLLFLLAQAVKWAEYQQGFRLPHPRWFVDARDRLDQARKAQARLMGKAR